MSYTTKVSMVSIIMLLVTIITCFYGFSAIGHISQLEAHWKAFSKGEVEITATLRRLQNDIGYSGFLNNFKILILSRDPSLFPLVEENLSDIEQDIGKLLKYDLSNDDQQVLNNLKVTIEAYRSQVDQARKSLIRGVSAKELEPLIKLDAAPAIVALDALSHSANSRRQVAESQAELTLNKTRRSLLIVSFGVPAFIAFGFFNLLLLKRLAGSHHNLEKQSDYLQMIIRAAPDGIFIVDKHGAIIQVNRQACEIFGYAEEDFLSMNIDELLLDSPWQEDQQSRNSDFHQLASRPMGQLKSLTAKHQSGRQFPVDISLGLFDDKNNNQRLAIAIVRDVSLRQKMEAELKHKESLLSEAQRLARLASWEWYPNDDTLYMTDSMKELVEQAELDYQGKIKNLFDFIHPEDLDKVKEKIFEATKSHTPYECEHRIVKNNGEELLVRSIGRPLLSESKDKLRLIGIIQDITQQKAIEDEIAQSAIVFNNTNDAIVVSDQNNKIIAVNRAYTEITGYSFTEVKGKDPGFARSGRQNDKFYKELWASLKTKGCWQGEIWDRRKNGNTYPKWVTINVVKNSLGEVSHYVELFTDISKLKQNEEKLWQLAHHDGLTGLPNRLLFNNELQNAILRCKRNREYLAVLFLDLDRFKKVNDSLGHNIGDELLKKVSRRIVSTLREEDIASRLGGDEFTIFLEGLKNEKDTRVIATNLLNSVKQPIEIRGHRIHMTVSIGISLYPKDADTSADLLKFADIAMYRAKKNGRNQIEFYREGDAER